MEQLRTATDLALIIQLAVAPVFLLAGIAGFLAVMSGRLGRIIDRARVLGELVASTPQQAELPLRELTIIWRRASLIQWAIGLCTTSALLICGVIVALFIGEFWLVVLDAVVVSLFVLALTLLIVALLLFLNEVKLSTRTLRLGGEYIAIAKIEQVENK